MQHINEIKLKYWYLKTKVDQVVRKSIRISIRLLSVKVIKRKSRLTEADITFFFQYIFEIFFSVLKYVQNKFCI